MKWQSIETAPKDRTPILAWNGKFVSEALWEPCADDNWHVGWCYSTFYNFESDGIYNNSYDKDAQPTHWMPLPSAPRVPLAPSAVTEESTPSNDYTEQERFEAWYEENIGDRNKTVKETAFSAWYASYQARADLVPLSDELPQGFISDVLTAAGLVRHGKQCKALADRIGDAIEKIWTTSIAQRKAITSSKW